MDDINRTDARDALLAFEKLLEYGFGMKDAKGERYTGFFFLSEHKFFLHNTDRDTIRAALRGVLGK